MTSWPGWNGRLENAGGRLEGNLDCIHPQNIVILRTDAQKFINISSKQGYFEDGQVNISRPIHICPSVQHSLCENTFSSPDGIFKSTVTKEFRTCSQVITDVRIS
jgi:hypothetical protein